MNHNLERLLEGMAETLRQSVLPQLDDEFARGQVYGVIFMLNSIARRADWSPRFLGEQVAALEELATTLARVEGAPESAPLLRRFAARPADLELAQARQLGNEEVCQLIDWLPGAELPEEVAGRVMEPVKAYIHRQLRHEITTSARPMFAEISRGSEE